MAGYAASSFDRLYHQLDKSYHVALFHACLANKRHCKKCRKKQSHQAPHTAFDQAKIQLVEHSLILTWCFFSSGLISDSSVFCDHIMRVHTILPKCHSLPFSSFSLTQPKLSVFIKVAMCAVEKTPHIQCTDCIQTTGVKTSWHELGPDLTKNLRKLHTHAAVTCQSQQPHPKTYPAILSILLLLGL